jgi:hypothetical protein
MSMTNQTAATQNIIFPILRLDSRSVRAIPTTTIRIVATHPKTANGTRKKLRGEISASGISASMVVILHVVEPEAIPQVYTNCFQLQRGS